YRDPDFEAEGLIPGFIATAVAYSIYSLAYGLGGFHPLFMVGVDLEAMRPLHLLPPLAILALAMALLALVYIRTFYGGERLFKALPWPKWFKPAVGGFLTGAVALWLYYAVPPLGPDRQHDVLSVLSFGYGFLQEVLAGQLPAQAGPALAILLVVGLG